MVALQSASARFRINESRLEMGTLSTLGMKKSNRQTTSLYLGSTASIVSVTGGTEEDSTA